MSEMSQVSQLKTLITSLLLLFISLLARTAIAQVSENCPAQNVADNFPSISYSQNSGTANWSGSWTEVGESNGPSSGIARVRNDLCASGNCLRLGVPAGNRAQSYSNKGVYREVDLGGASSATLSFDYRRGANQGSQTVILSVSNNGGGSWSELQRYFINSTNNSIVSASFDITDFATNDTQIRFLADGNNAVIGMYIDNIDISYQPTCTLTPILDYHFDELTWNGTPNEVLDSSENNNNGSAIGGITTDTGKICNAANIPNNTSSSTIQAIDSGVDLDSVVGSKGTISLWYKGSTAWDSGSDKRLFDATDGNKYFFAEISASGKVKFWFEDGRDGDYQKTTVNAISVGANVWKHLTFVWDVTNQTAKIFVDGLSQRISGDTGGTTAFTGYDTLYFGDNRDRSYFTGEASADGLIDEVLVFDSVLASTQIQTIFTQQNTGNNYDGSPRTCPSPPMPLVEYRFEETSWNGSADEIIDNSGNGYHAQVNNNSTPETTLPALTGNIGTCGYASQNDGSIQVTGLPLNTSTNGVKTTVTFWMNWDGTNDVMPVGWDFHDIWIRNGSIGFNTWNTDIYGVSSAGLANEWHHIAVEFTNGSVINNRMHIDGVEQTLTQRFGTPNNSRTFVNSQMRVGGVATSNIYDFHGLLDEFRVYEGALTTAQIGDIMSERHDCGVLTPVVEYRFDEVSWRGDSGEVADNSGNGLNGSAVGDTTTISAGQICRAGTFDGTEDYIDVSGIDSYLSTTASMSFWIKTSQSGNNSGWSAPGIAGVEQQNGTNDIFWGFMDASGHIRIHKGNGTAAISSTLIKDDNWHHVVLTRDSSSGVVQVFIDGTLEDSVISGIGDVSTAFSSIGRIEEAYSRLNFIGQLDELLIFDSVISASDVNSIYTNQLSGNNYDGSTRTCPAIPLDHFEIQHDEQGFTCEAETVTIKACADEECSVLYDQETSITLSPSGWSGGDTLTFTGELTTTLSVTDESTITMVKTSASPDANLYCFNGDTETCDITFSDDGFEIYGANIGDPLSDQLAASNFLDVNLRAVRSNENVCEALLVGTHEINLSYNCDSPDKCLTPLNGITITNETGENTGNIEVEFNAQGVASLALLNYPDAGRLKLSVQAEVDGVNINNSDIETVDVYPSYLTLSVEETELVYGNSDNQNNYMAGKPFTFVIGAYGKNDELLPNYLSENPEIKVDRIRPLNSGQEGIFKYSGTGTQTTNTNASFEAASDLSFSSGQHSYTDAYYSEVGRIEVDFKDTAYLGNEILSNSPLILGDFYPAYFKVEVTELPTLADTCGVFSYLGEAIGFDTDPELTITAYNAEDEITQNYSSSTDTDDNFWNYAPTQTLLSTNLSYIDNSSYPETSTLITAGDTPSITDSDSFDGTGKITITNGSFKYDKVDTDDIAYTPVSPFDASIFLEFNKAFFNVTFVGQGGSETICNKETYASTCEGLTTDEITGTEIRYGRLVLESTYGPETEALNVPIKTEYFQDPQWLVNTDDNCTSIAFSLSAGQILLTAIDDDITGEFDEVESDGMLLMGVAVGDQLTLNAPSAQGQLELSLVPTAIGIEWPSYLNYNWNHTNDEDDNTIDSDDYPKATISFGLFRGNDRIIHWREVFN